ncbi:MAG: tetratricopeptide repeat protein [Chloroflexi bacterium]|nr:tetratricopeptide repeat protein [Chloroflexota bacterium]
MSSYKESLALSEQIEEQAGAAICAFNLGHAYKNLPALRDLAAAEQWYGRSLAMHDEGDRLGRGKCHNQLGLVAYERFQEARAAGAAEAEPLKHLNAALTYYQQALALLPANAVNDLAVTHNQLGLIYDDAGQTPRALEHYQQAIHYVEAAGQFVPGGTNALQRGAHAVPAGAAARRPRLRRSRPAQLPGLRPPRRRRHRKNPAPPASHRPGPGLTHPVMLSAAKHPPRLGRPTHPVMLSAQRASPLAWQANPPPSCWVPEASPRLGRPTHPVMLSAAKHPPRLAGQPTPSC